MSKEPHTFYQAARVTFTEDATTGGFLNDPLATWRIARLAALGQKVLCTPTGLADLWGVERRVIGRLVLTLRHTVSIEGSAWVREASISKIICESSWDYGTTLDLSCAVGLGHKMPTGPVSMWRGRGLPKAKRQAVFERDGRVCAYCKATSGDFHIDHVIPVASGGTDDLENLVPSCSGCNLAKASMSVEAFLAKRRLAE